MTQEQRQRAIPGVGRWAGFVLYIGVGILNLISGLFVPVPWLILLNLVWVVGLVVAVRWSRDRWWAAFALSVAALVFWVAYVAAGRGLLGWTT